MWRQLSGIILPPYLHFRSDLPLPSEYLDKLNKNLADCGFYKCNRSFPNMRMPDFLLLLDQLLLDLLSADIPLAVACIGVPAGAGAGRVGWQIQQNAPPRYGGHWPRASLANVGCPKDWRSSISTLSTEARAESARNNEAAKKRRHSRERSGCAAPHAALAFGRVPPAHGSPHPYPPVQLFELRRPAGHNLAKTLQALLRVYLDMGKR